MQDRDPIRNFEALWLTFRDRYPFFELRQVDWNEQYKLYRPQVSAQTRDDELFHIICDMLQPLNDGHVEIEARFEKGGKKKRFTPEDTPRFWKEFETKRDIKRLFKTTEKTLTGSGFSKVRETKAWMLLYGTSETCGYMRILELEDIKKRKLAVALDKIARDFANLNGMIIDVRDCPGGDDSTALAIANRFCGRRQVAFHRKTKLGPGADDFSQLKTWHMEPAGGAQFTKPVVLLTSDSVFSGGEAFVLAMRELPHVTIVGDQTNGIFSYTLERDLPNGWEYRLSYQVYLSADGVCYEGLGVPPDIELRNTKADLERGVDPLIERALHVISIGNAGGPI